MGLAVLGFLLGWILARVRLRGPAPRPVFVAADYVADPRDERLYDEVREGGDILLVPRHSRTAEDVRQKFPSFIVAAAGDGWIPLRRLGDTVGTALRDWWRLMTWTDLPPGLFYRVISLPYRRLALRAFLHRFRPQFYWGRDDYNEDHILRRQELRAVDSVSLGLNHGYTHYSNHSPMWRYISFDRYYTFGAAHYNRYMHETWAPDMVVVPSGSFGATREDYAHRFDPRPRDIGVLTAAFVCEERMVEFVRGLATAFPDRTIWLQVKVIFVDTDDGRAFIAACTEGLPNVRHTRDSIFDIFRRVSYAFSDPSSAVVEAIQFGVCSFLTDVLPVQKVSLYREFPGICVTSADEAAGRIKGIESGARPYPRRSLGELVDLSGRVYFDSIRGDVGLPPKEDAIPLPDVA